MLRPYTELELTRQLSPTSLNDCDKSILYAAVLDALFAEKPVMMFAENYISVIPSIHKIKNILELPDNIKKMLQEQVNPVDLEKYIQFSEKISFKFNPIAFSQDISDFFHFSGQLVDVEITENKMNIFLEKEKKKIGILSDEYIKKMSLSN